MTTRLILAYVRRHLGDAAVDELLALAGELRGVEVLEDERSWSSYDQKIALFEAAATLTGDVHVARRIGESVLAEQLGAMLRTVIGALGSPQRVLSSVARANVKFSTAATMRAIEISAGHGIVSYRLHEDHVPSHHDCGYTRGLLAQVTVLFGLPPATIRHARCQIEGADECVYELTWPRWRWWFRFFHPRRRLAEGTVQDRVRDLERTVADLVAADDVDEVLSRIAWRAGGAVHAQGHLLAVLIDGRELIHADGIPAVQTWEIGRTLLETGAVDIGRYVPLVAPVASARRHYGWLAALLPAGSGFLPVERDHLETYAGLAAAALDVAWSLQAARRSDRVNTTLLTLGRRLANEDDQAALAQRVAEAVPVVVTAQRARVMLWDEPCERLVTVASAGFPSGPGGEAPALDLSAQETAVVQAMLADHAPRFVERGDGGALDDELLARLGRRGAALAPIVAGGEVLGLLVAAQAAGPSAATDPGAMLAALAGVADQAGTAIARLRLLEAARHAATHDHLTGLPGRALLLDRVERTLADLQRRGGLAAVCFLDLDGFKAVNDTFGHAAGDAVLTEVADRLRRGVRATDSVARIAGDEFTVLLREVADEAAAREVAESLVAALCVPYELADGPVSIGVSIGIALAPEHGPSAATLLKAADTAMYQAKSSPGRGTPLGAVRLAV